MNPYAPNTPPPLQKRPGWSRIVRGLCEQILLGRSVVLAGPRRSGVSTVLALCDIELRARGAAVKCVDELGEFVAAQGHHRLGSQRLLAGAPLHAVDAIVARAAPASRSWVVVTMPGLAAEDVRELLSFDGFTPSPEFAETVTTWTNGHSFACRRVAQALFERRAHNNGETASPSRLFHEGLALCGLSFLDAFPDLRTVADELHRALEEHRAIRIAPDTPPLIIEAVAAVAREAGRTVVSEVDLPEAVVATESRLADEMLTDDNRSRYVNSIPGAWLDDSHLRMAMQYRWQRLDAFFAGALRAEAVTSDRLWVVRPAPVAPCTEHDWVSCTNRTDLAELVGFATARHGPRVLVLSSDPDIGHNLGTHLCRPGDLTVRPRDTTGWSLQPLRDSLEAAVHLASGRDVKLARHLRMALAQPGHSWSEALRAMRLAVLASTRAVSGEAVPLELAPALDGAPPSAHRTSLESVAVRHMGPPGPALGFCEALSGGVRDGSSIEPLSTARASVILDGADAIRTRWRRVFQALADTNLMQAWARSWGLGLPPSVDDAAELALALEVATPDEVHDVWLGTRTVSLELPRPAELFVPGVEHPTARTARVVTAWVGDVGAFTQMALPASRGPTELRLWEWVVHRRWRHDLAQDLARYLGYAGLVTLYRRELCSDQPGSDPVALARALLATIDVPERPTISSARVRLDHAVAGLATSIVDDAGDPTRLRGAVVKAFVHLEAALMEAIEAFELFNDDFHHYVCDALVKFPRSPGRVRQCDLRALTSLVGGLRKEGKPWSDWLRTRLTQVPGTLLVRALEQSAETRNLWPHAGERSPILDDDVRRAAPEALSAIRETLGAGLSTLLPDLVEIVGVRTDYWGEHLDAVDHVGADITCFCPKMPAVDLANLLGRRFFVVGGSNPIRVGADLREYRPPPNAVPRSDALA